MPDSKSDGCLLADVAALGDFAAAQLGTVHLWVNNAGAVTGKGLLDAIPAAEIGDAVGTNVLGSLLCCRWAAPAAPGHHSWKLLGHV